MAGLIGAILIIVFLLIVGGTILQSIIDVCFSIFGWAIIIGLIIIGVSLGEINPMGYILSVIGVGMIFMAGGAE
jgi:hypothetical protein